MIGFVDGVLAGRSPEGCLIDVNGVGYAVACSTTTLAALPAEGDRCRLWTHVHVREDVLALFGFATESERGMFNALIGVSGVGPKVALQLCSAFTPDAFRRALRDEDAAAIASVPGIGNKTAQRIVVDLKEKLGSDGHGLAAPHDARAQARSALENLGYTSGEIRVALGKVEPTPDDAVEDVIKSALKVLA